jgi:hypothetical protein
LACPPHLVSVVLLGVTLVLMMVQFAHASGSKLPQHAPKSLPPGVIGLDGWAQADSSFQLFVGGIRRLAGAQAAPEEPLNPTWVQAVTDNQRRDGGST